MSRGLRAPSFAPHFPRAIRSFLVPLFAGSPEKVRKIERIEAAILETQAIYLGSRGSTVTSRFGMLDGGRLSLSHFEVSGAFYRI